MLSTSLLKDEPRNSTQVPLVARTLPLSAKDFMHSGLCWGSIGVILGLHWGYIGVIVGLHWGYIGVILGLYWGYDGDISGSYCLILDAVHGDLLDNQMTAVFYNSSSIGGSNRCQPPVA